MRRPVRVRTRFFVAVEGESEQSFVKWLQLLSEESCHIHLDCVVLAGGGFKSMLTKAVRFHHRHCLSRGTYADRFLIVDADRSEQDDCSIAELTKAATEKKFHVFAQKPNHEGFLLRLLPGMAQKTVHAKSAIAELQAAWPTYHKPVNALALQRRFTLADLHRLARHDSGLHDFLTRIGLGSAPNIGFPMVPLAK